MGFLKFLKRDKKEDTFKDLDMPPAPPPLEGFEENIPEIPDFAEIDKGDISAPKEELPKEEFPKFEFPEIGEKTLELGKEDLPDFESLQEIEKMPLPPIEPAGIKTEISESTVPEQMETITPGQMGASNEEFPGIMQPTAPMPAAPIRRRPSDVSRVNLAFNIPRKEKERDFEQIIKSGTSMYVRIDKFKVAIGSINIIRSDLRKSEDTLIKLENIKVTKDKYFDKVRLSLDDLQKKIIFIDKTLFKGE